MAIEKEKSKQDFLDKINLLKANETIENLDADLDNLEAQLDRIKDEHEQRDERKKQIVEHLNNLDKKISGEPVGLIEKFKRKSAPIVNSFDIDKFEKKINNSIHDFMNLIALYLLKTIIFPLIFFYIVVLVIKHIWKMEWGIV